MVSVDFSQLLKGQSSVAVGISGGPDSMALGWLLSNWARDHNVQVHAITVDHALRTESAAEATSVAGWVKDWPNTRHTILRWEGSKPTTRILEEARSARYDLMLSYMKGRGITHLCVAHHQDDQAETFLIRLAKGSGLDGLAGMKPLQGFEGGVLVRPLLDISKQGLIDLCRDKKIPYVLDPTNENEKYLRPRLRASREVLEEEGLSSKRLSGTARRLARAQSALAHVADEEFGKTLRGEKDGGLVFDTEALKELPEEITIRIVLKAMDLIHPGGDYGPRLEKVEHLVERIRHDPAFNGATLGGCLFAIQSKNGTLWIGKEPS